MTGQESEEWGQQQEQERFNKTMWWVTRKWEMMFFSSAPHQDDLILTKINIYVCARTFLVTETQQGGIKWMQRSYKVLWQISTKPSRVSEKLQTQQVNNKVLSYCNRKLKIHHCWWEKLWLFSIFATFLRPSKQLHLFPQFVWNAAHLCLVWQTNDDDLLHHELEHNYIFIKNSKNFFVNAAS